MNFHRHLFRVTLTVLIFYTTLLAEFMSLLQPADKSVLNEPYASVVVKVDERVVDTIKIVIDENRTHTLYAAPPRQTYCKSVQLKLGENHLLLTGYKNGKVVAKSEATLYHRSPMHKGFKYPPSDFTAVPFHIGDKEESCTQCHDMQVNEVPGIAFEDVTKSNCYTCHNAMTKRQQGHAPAVNWLCTSCHSAKEKSAGIRQGDTPRFSTQDPIVETCFSCHEKSKEKWWNKRFHHEPADSGFCTHCHNPHASEHEFFLRKSIWDTCISCHGDKVDGTRHIVAAFSRRNHPTQGVPDPSRPGKELTCSSCHYPHGSNVGFLLRSENENIGSICHKCHKK